MIYDEDIPFLLLLIFADSAISISFAVPLIKDAHLCGSKRDIAAKKLGFNGDVFGGSRNGGVGNVNGRIDGLELFGAVGLETKDQGH
jgi:hypothetical protein